MGNNKVSLLLFKVGDLFFSVNTDLLKMVVEIDENELFPAYSFPESVIGFLRHNGRVFLLFCLAKVLGIHSCPEVDSKDAVVVEIGGNTWAFIVDRVEKIFQVEKSDYKTGEVNIYQIEGNVVEELTADFFLNHISVPGMENRKSEERKILHFEEGEEEKVLVLKQGNLLAGIKADDVLKIEEIEESEKQQLKGEGLFNKVCVVGDRIIKTAPLSSLISEENQEERETSTVVVMKKGQSVLGLEVEEVEDMIELSEDSRFENSTTNSKFECFLKYKNRVVPVISQEFLEKLLREEGVIDRLREETKKEKSSEEINFLVISIGNKEFAVEMSFVDRIYKMEDVHLSPYPSKLKYLDGIVTTKRESYFLVSLDRFLGTQIKESEENRILVVQTVKGDKVAFKVSEVTNLLTVPDSLYHKLADGSKFIIRGTVMDSEGKLYEVLNPEAVFAKTGNEELPCKGGEEDCGSYYRRA